MTIPLSGAPLFLLLPSLQPLQVPDASAGPVADDMEERTTDSVLTSHCTGPISSSNCSFKILHHKPYFLLLLLSP